MLLVGIAIAYDTFFAEETAKGVVDNGTKTFGPISQFVKKLSDEVPVLYGLASITLALVLGVGAAIVRRFFSNLARSYGLILSVVAFTDSNFSDDVKNFDEDCKKF